MDIMTGRQYPIINGTRNMITTITGYMRWVNGVVLRRGGEFLYAFDSNRHIKTTRYIKGLPVHIFY